MCVCVCVCQDSLKTKETLITWTRAGRETNELAALIGQQTIFEPATFRSNTPKFPAESEVYVDEDACGVGF